MANMYDGNCNILKKLSKEAIMLVNTIAELIAERIGCDAADIHENSTFKSLGIDSLDTVEILMNLEDVTGVKIELSEKVETVGELAALIESKKEGAK